MSSTDEKLQPPGPPSFGRARATLKQLTALWGRLEELESENGKPTRVRHTGMDSSQVWKRLNGDIWEME